MTKTIGYVVLRRAVVNGESVRGYLSDLGNGLYTGDPRNATVFSAIAAEDVAESLRDFAPADEPDYAERYGLRYSVETVVFHCGFDADDRSVDIHGYAGPSDSELRTKTEAEAESSDYWNDIASDGEADGDALASCGFGTDEDYGCYGGDEW